ncbi:DUF742 domain-containing protein [Streptomyces sp. BK340]|uniref:DUF742 domain-containing protein n=1 Tax=Streptomyces sp. BK340 TaxID=2572903 RepID=UPI0011A1885B|nr:DUF742 domain-containing protein [Streptomyces sp. BK340]TVZ90397.1 uncharacterized protein DUF742 [Streptomyces sp. BK340]
MTAYPPEPPSDGAGTWTPGHRDAAFGEAVPLGLAPRPFLLTHGRTHSASKAIAIETQVVASERAQVGWEFVTFERRDIIELCREPLSVAEISARLGLHLNVVRVLVGDLYAEGRVTAYLPEFDASQDVDTLRRVIRGLRAIS